MIPLDCSYGEGGGQIVRTALGLSALTKQPFDAFNIRYNRKVPGLKAQHLSGILALQKLCRAKLVGAKIKSQHLEFYPGKMGAKTISIDIGTAGSITLALQSLILPSLFADKRVLFKVRGGTDVEWSPQIDYFSNVFVPHLRKYADVSLSLRKRGYYPKGGGEIELKIKPRISVSDFCSFEEFVCYTKEEVPAIDLTEPGKLILIKGISHASSNLELANVAERQARSARQSLSSLGCPVNIRTEYCNTASPGSGITLWAVYGGSSGSDELSFSNPVRLGSDVLGQKGRKSETVGRMAAENLLSEIGSGAAVDKHLADHLIPFLGLFSGSIKISEMTSHLRTNIWTSEQFLGKVFSVDLKKKIISVP